MSIIPDSQEEAANDFLHLLAQGEGRLNAAVIVGWTPAQMERWMRDDEFAKLVYEVEERKTENVEKVLYEKATGGHMDAIKMFLFNRKPERWSDRKHVDIAGHVEVEHGMVVAVKEAVHGLLGEHMAAGSIAALQPGGALDDEITDAEVVED